MTALADAVAFRGLSDNQISTIANGTFAGLTALTLLYDARLWGFMVMFGSRWCLHGCGDLFPQAYLRPAFL